MPIPGSHSHVRAVRHNPGPYGDADLLAKAKDTSAGGVCEAASP